MRIYCEEKALRIYLKIFIEKSLKSFEDDFRNMKPAGKKITTATIGIIIVIN